MGEPPPVPGPLPVDEGIRLDISPYQGQLVQRLNIYSDASQVNTYAFQLSLIHGMWGYQQGVFYSREYGSPAALNDLAQWFGVEFVIVHPDIDPIEKYVQAGWDRVWSDREVEIWRFPDRTGMATATSRPSLLVVGKSDADAFMNVFRVANEGMLGYEEALLVQGKARIDAYDLDELRRFDAVILYGY
ncbi:MAG: hypothetical protein GTO63_13185, partial [Anaerolineae bacterium]|nr:hypothetical protein [Anaerolineae bacterium]NIN95797.1 hypothetical protein [Anaerolineae bacterium]